MWPVSSGYVTAVTGSHTVVQVAELLVNGVATDTLQLVSGSVAVDGSAQVRRRASFSLVDPTGKYMPPAGFNWSVPPVLHPVSGNELRLWRGVMLPAGSASPKGLQPSGAPAGSELVPLGVFNIDELNIEDTGEGLTISGQGYDRSVKIAQSKWTRAFVIAAGTNVVTALRQMVASRMPTAIINFAGVSTTHTLPLTVFDYASNGNPWSDMQTLATSIGCDLYFDQLGVLVLRMVMNPDLQAPVWQYTEGAGATILKVSRKMSRAGVYNHVVVSGESPDGTPPVRAEASDTNPNSPTRISNYGDVVYTLSSPLITTQAQAQQAADGMLNSVKSLQEAVAFDAHVNPAHEAGDIVTVSRRRIGVDANYSLTSFNVPLAHSGVMSATTRVRNY